MITIDEMQDMLEEITEEVPEAFFKDLNGGILLLPEAKLSKEARHNDLYTLGEYVSDHSMGRYIIIYYGSFSKLFKDASIRSMRRQLRETLFHEFTHHLERLAGERGLEIKDQEQMERYLACADEAEKQEEGGESGFIWSPKLRK